MTTFYCRYKFSFILFLLFSVPFLSSCEKFKEDPKMQIVLKKINDDGTVSVTAEILSGKKNVESVGFCLGKNSLPEADLNSNMHFNTIFSSVNNDKFSATIPANYFESYTGYYIRPYAVSNSKTVYGDQIYLENIHSPLTTPPCSPADNAINIGSITGTEHFTTVKMTPGQLSEYTIRASSNSHMFTLEFQQKPRTGIYTTGYTEGQKDVNIYFVSGFISGSASPGSPVYVNEVEKDKFEISFCGIPWKYGNSTFQMTSKMILN